MNLRRFAQPDVLKNISQPNLITFLKQYENYLTKRGFSFELNDDELDLETLRQILMNPTEDMDIEFVEALFFIQEMSGDKRFEELSEQAEANNIDVHEDSTAADLALALWLHDPELLKRPHAEVMILKPKSFMYFQSDQKSPDTFDLPKAETMRTLEADMDAWFSKNKRGTGCRILPVSAADDEDKTYFLIRHGMPFKREGKIESGQSKTIFYRPEFHDVIVYDRANNELAVFNKSGAKKERTMYLDLFSQHLFGQAEYFPGAEKYTLQPLIDNGDAALACADIDGLEAVKLVEIRLQFPGLYNDRQTLQSNDIFASLKARNREFPASGKLVSASFSVKFENAKRPRRVTVRTPNVANFDRKEDSHLIERWLRKRGFVNEQQEEESTQPATHQESHDAASIAAMA